jgi:hypothetical protein
MNSQLRGIPRYQYGIRLRNNGLLRNIFCLTIYSSSPSLRFHCCAICFSTSSTACASECRQGCHPLSRYLVILERVEPYRFLRCLCLTRPWNESGFRSPRCHSHCIGMNGVLNHTIHSSFHLLLIKRAYTTMASQLVSLQCWFVCTAELAITPTWHF